jgi:hypothetical protein
MPPIEYVLGDRVGQNGLKFERAGLQRLNSCSKMSLSFARAASEAACLLVDSSTYRFRARRE